MRISALWDHNPDYFRFRRTMPPGPPPRSKWTRLDWLEVAWWLAAIFGAILMTIAFDVRAAVQPLEVIGTAFAATVGIWLAVIAIGVVMLGVFLLLAALAEWFRKA